MTTRIRSRWLASGALFAALTISVVATAKLSKTGTPTASFHATGPAGMSIDGTTSDVRLADDGATVTVTAGLGSISTGIGLRDKHTKEYLETDKFPDAELKVSRGSLKFPAAGGESSGDAKGTLKIHGQSKDVTFHYTAKQSGDTFDIKGSASININDFGVKTPSYLGVSVKPDMSINVQFQAKDG